ncbi:MAG: YgcG family protein [Prolixibacteraceae bacterium]
MKKIFIAIFAVFIGVSLFAQDDLPVIPNPPTLVTDFAHVFSKTEQAQLERKLVDFFAATSTQIAVVTVPDLQGYDVADYAVKLGHKWGVGGGEFDNGIMVLLKPKTAQSNGDVYIAVGYGLEAVVPDAIAKQIVENEMIPRFKAGDMFGGLDQATTVLIDLSKGEYNYEQYAKNSERVKGFNPFLLIILIFFIFPILFGRRKRGMYSAGGRNSSLPFWVALGLMSGGRRSGSFNDFSRGSGSFGGGGSSFGSFGGFGGGGFGGGGAGGSW